ncbi:MAG: M57 family metalloprotease [Pseudoruegeria sp.]
MLRLAILIFFGLGASANGQEALHQVVEPTTFWKNGREISVYFYNGNPALDAKVMTYAKTWSRFANISFRRSSNKNSDIRVQFNAGVEHSSKLGRSALGVTDPDTPTMKLGVNLSSSESDFRRVVLHEFGHVLGLTHEQFYDGANIPWNRTAVIDFYTGPPNNWTISEIEWNILNPQGTNFGSYDPLSIMHYPVSNSLTEGDFEIGNNTKLSQNDRIAIAQIYPKIGVSASRKTVLVNRPFDYKSFGDYKVEGFSSDDNIRAWSLNGGFASYMHTDGNETFLITRTYDGTRYGDPHQIKFSSRDNIRGWNWDRENGVASYFGYQPEQSNKTILYIRSFDGTSFGEVQQEIIFSTGDNIRGWSWDGNTANYIAVHPTTGDTTLYIRPFTENGFTAEYSTIPFGSADIVRGWNVSDGNASYLVAQSP